MTAGKTQKIVPMLWFDDQAEEAAKFYASVFPDSRLDRIVRYPKAGREIHGREAGTVMTADFLLEGQRFTALNGGPVFQINPSISFMALYDSLDQVEAIWKKLNEGGTVVMPLEKYPWSERYGWVQDRYGVSWQIALGDKKDTGGLRFTPSLLFVGGNYGRAEEAMRHYASVFKDAKIEGALHYGPEDKPERDGAVKHAQFYLDGQTFAVMDSGLDHPFNFNEGVSLIVRCDNQEEVDYYWDKLSQGGDPKAQVCGWLKDKFGVSWQVVPVALENMIAHPDPARVERVTRSYLAMKKFDVAELEKAFAGSA